MPDSPAPPSANTASGPEETRPASPHTLLAYGRDWAHFTRWCRLKGVDPLPPSAELIALYLSDLAAAPDGARALSAATIDRRLSGLVWNYTQRGLFLDRKSREIIAVLTEIRQRQARPPARKEAIRADDILAMTATLPHDLRGLRDRAILLLGYAGGLRRSELVGLDLRSSDAPGSGGRVEIYQGGALVTLNGRTGRHEIEVGRGSTKRSCPVHALEQWLDFARIESGPVFTRVSRDGKRALDTRLNDRHIARLIKRTALDAGLRAELPEKDRLALFSGHSLRAGLINSIGLDGRHDPKSPEPSTDDAPPRRERFRMNLTRAAGL
ncbi:tyrosine-type recombinase/integrase [Salipiger abyssi]|uniref:tyrosine-type recombinase/integrase n=1 Tax=Salipiger abyssi TaxID=1250539 RepID=UPI00405992D1